MKILVLGGTGFIGCEIVKQLHRQGQCVTVGARKQAQVDGCNFVRVDATNRDSLRPAIQDADAVVCAVTGSGRSIRDSALAIVSALQGMPRAIPLVLLSSMAVYGYQQGLVDESASIGEGCNWYGDAKIEAENAVRAYAESMGSATILRIGCVYGPGSKLWVDRIGMLLKNGRLGDIAEMGDGWSNLVHVGDVAKAVALSLEHHRARMSIYNLAAPDSPRWNDYFRDFALGIACTPLIYKTRLSMLIETHMIAPPLKVLERIAERVPFTCSIPESIPPSLLRLWSQQIRLDSRNAERNLQLDWTPYPTGLEESLAYFKARHVA